MEVERDATMKAQAEIEIAAATERVWAALTGIERWPEWQPGVTAARLEGGLEVGRVFRWKANGVAIHSTIRELEPGRRIAWSGKSPGLRAIHAWSLEASEGGTRVAVMESLSGWLAFILRIIYPGFLEKSMAASVAALKGRSESRE